MDHQNDFRRDPVLTSRSSEASVGWFFAKSPGGAKVKGTLHLLALKRSGTEKTEFSLIRPGSRCGGLVLPNGALAFIIYSLFSLSLSACGRGARRPEDLVKPFALQGRLMDGGESTPPHPRSPHLLSPQDLLGSRLLVRSLSIHLCIFSP